jgi:hypothetical protein
MAAFFFCSLQIVGIVSVDVFMAVFLWKNGVRVEAECPYPLWCIDKLSVCQELSGIFQSASRAGDDAERHVCPLLGIL